MADELVFTLSIKDNASPQIDAFTRKIKGLGQEAQKEFGAFRENFNKSFGDLGKPINSVNDFRTAVLGLSGAFAAIGVQKAGQFVADSVKNFAAYEQSLASVQRTVGMTKEQTAQLGESLRTLALTDLKGQVIADDLAAIAEAAGQMGITAEEDILAFSKAVAQVSVATGQDMEKTALSFGRIADLFKESLGADAYQQIGNIGSAFDALADSSSASVQGILNYTNRLAGTATALGLTVDQTAAIGATLESMGVPAERGSTAISKVFLQLKKDSGSFAEALSIDADKLKTALETKPVEGVNMVIEAMAKMNAERPTEFLTTMEDLLGKGSGVTEVVLKLSEGSQQLSTNMSTAAKAMGEGTRAGESFGTAASTQAASWQAIKTAVDDLSKSVGQQLQPALNTLGNWLSLAATWWAEAFRADNINAFFDDVVSGWEILKQEADNFKKAWSDVVSGLKQEWETFVKAITDSIQKVKQVVSDVKGIIKDALPGGDSKSLSVSGFEKGTVNALNEIKTANIELLRSNQELKTQYLELQTAFNDAYANGGQPTQALVESTQRLKDAMAAAGGETSGLTSLLTQMSDATMGADYALEGGSLTPALRRYIEAALASGTATAGLTSEMQATMQGVLAADAAYSQLEKDLNQNQRAILEVEKSMQALKQASISASDFGKKQIAEELKGLQVKRSELMLQKKTIQEQMDLKREEIDLGKDAVKVFEDQQKAQEEAAKARIKAEEELQKNTERTADLRRKQQEDEMKAANDLYREQQKQAADSIKWISQLDDATKKRILGEQDAVKILQEQGIELTDLQQQEVRRMQAAYKTEAAYEAQAQALQAQMNPMGALIAAGEKLSGSLGGLSGGVGKIGGLFGIDTSGITDVISKIQGFSELPKVFADIKSSFEGFSELPKVFADIESSLAGIGDAFKSLKGFDLKSIFSGGGGISGLISSLSGIGSVAGIIKAAWKPIEDLFKNVFGEHKSKGRKATEAFQEFVKANVDGGAQLAKAMGQARENMNFHDQFASLTSDTYQLWNAFANTPIDGVNTGLQLLERTMKAAGVPTEKLGQVAIQTFAAMQNSGMDAAQMATTLADMLDLTQAQAEALAAAFGATGAATQQFADSTAKAVESSKSSADATSSLTGSLGAVSKGYASAADAARAFAQAQQQAAIYRSMQGLSTPPTYHTGGIVQRYHTGGLIDWTAAQKAHSGMMLKRDEVPIIAQTGEAVLNRGAVSMLGVGGVNALNRGAMGGTVINVSITGNTISKDTDLRVLAREVSAEISRSYRARA